jgi:hypothetical protein
VNEIRNITDIKVAALNDEIRVKTGKIENLERMMATESQQLSKKKEALSKLRQELSSLQQKCSSLETQLEKSERRNETLEAAEGANADMMVVKEATVAALTAELKEKDKFLQLSKNKVLEPLPSVLTCNLPLKWSNPMNMPLGMWAGQAVLLGGNIYVGGGEAEANRLLKFKIEGNVWTLISCPVENFGLAVVSDQLMAIGGTYKNSGAIDEVWAFNPATAAWSQPFPRMPTSRSWASAIGFKRWVIVAGGAGKKCVEVLDTVTKEWYNAIALPRETARPSLTILQETLYVVMEKSMISISLPVLIADAMSHNKDPTQWDRLPDTLTSQPALVAFHGHLLAVGAFDAPSTTIAMYLPLFKQWQTVAELLTPRESCSCLVLPETKNKILVIGGCGNGVNSKYMKTWLSGFRMPV